MAKYQWLGSGGGAFDSAAQWANPPNIPALTPPGPGDTAGIGLVSGVISGNGNVGTLSIGFSTVTFTGTITADDVGIAGSDSITVSGGTLTGSTIFTLSATGNTVTVTNGGSLVGPDVTASELTDFGTIDINNGGAHAYHVQVFGAASVQSGTIDATITGVGGSGTSTIGIGDGGVVQDGTGFIGSTLGGASAATLHGAGAKWTNTQFFSVAALGPATMTVQGGASLDAQGGGAIGGTPALSVGYGANGSLSVQDAGSKVSVTGDAGIGVALGSGTLALSGDGSIDVTGTLDAGAGGGVGTITLTGASASADTAVIGDLGTGTLIADAGGDLSTTSDTVIGAQAGSTGSVTLNAGGSLFVGGTLTVADGGTGSLLVNGGSLTENGLVVTIGAQAGSSGKLTAQGTTLDLVADLKVGDAGAGSVLVQSAAHLAADAVTLGGQLGSSGGFTVDGAGSAAELNSATVGAAGKGSLKASGSAHISTTGDLSVATLVAPGVTSSVVVDTQGDLQVSGNLTVGGSASATMKVQGAGQAIGANVIVGDNLSGSGTLTVTGTIATGGGTAQSQLFYGGALTVGAHGAGTLVVAKGAAVGPEITGHGTIEIASESDGTGSISLTDAGSTLTGALLAVGGNDVAAGGTGELSIGAGATVTAGTVEVWDTGSVVLAGGTLNTDPVAVAGRISGYGSVAGAITSRGTIAAVGGALVLSAAVAGSGGALLVGSKTGDGTLELMHGAAATQTIGFNSGVLVLDDLAHTAATIGSFGAGDTIDLTAVAADGRSFAGGVLTLTSGGGSVGTLAFKGSYTTDDFKVVAQGGSATEISFAGPAPCYAAGTRIATVRGAVAVEHLRAGDRVISAFGGSAPVVWLGQRRVDCRGHPKPASVWPVRVRAGALADGLPARDLVLSPDHALYVGEALIPVRYLINGTTVAQESVDAVTYFHLELPVHDVIFAEGFPAESYLDTGNRSAFENGGAVVDTHPDFAREVWLAEACAEQVTHGARLEAVRRRLLARAAMLERERSAVA